MTLSFPFANKGLSAEDVFAHWAFQPKGSRTILHKVVVTKFFHSWHTNFCCHDYEAERIRGTEATYSQGNLDWHGNPSWFSGLQDESNFQTKISHKWLEILVSFFHIMKIWYFGLHLVLVTCYYPNLSKNGSHLKKSVQKFEFCCWAKLVNFQHF